MICEKDDASKIILTKTGAYVNVGYFIVLREGDA